MGEVSVEFDLDSLTIGECALVEEAYGVRLLGADFADPDARRVLALLYIAARRADPAADPGAVAATRVADARLTLVRTVGNVG